LTRLYWLWAPNSVFGPGGLLMPFWPPKEYFFMLLVKFPIDGCITRPYWFWAPNSVFGLFCVLRFEPLKVSIFLIYIKLPNWWVLFNFKAPQCPAYRSSRFQIFFGLRTISILRFKIFVILLSFCSRRACYLCINI
jgi:hypothetical protein